MGDPWGFYGLSKEEKIDLIAYWHISKRNSSNRWLLSNPSTLRDLYDILLTSKGKAPRSLFDDSSKKPISSAVRQDWQKQTGSSPEAIAWWTG